MKKLIFLFLFIFISQTGYSWCLWRIGNSCDKPALKNVKRWWKHSVEKKSNYRHLFVGITGEAYSVPYQDAEKATKITKNRSYHAEIAITEKLSFKVQKMDLSFRSYNENYLINHEHLFGLVMVRLYFLESLVLRGGAGFGQANVSIVHETEDANKNSKFEEKDKYTTNTSVMQTSLAYIWPEESITIGLAATSISGNDGERNFGATSYGLSFALGFL